MSWLEPSDSTSRALRYSSNDGNGWSAPEKVVEHPDLFANWADLPKLISLPGGRLAAHYSVSSGDHPLANDFVIQQKGPHSTWQQPVIPHNDGTATQHGFGSMVPFEDALLAIWLDGRSTTLVEGNYDESEWGEMNLYGALIDATGKVNGTTLLDERVCDCCPTAAVATDSGALVAYRDRGADERRDINLIRFDGATWSSPYLLHEDGWDIAGCPVNGPALSASGDRVVAGWFTAADDLPRVQVAFSDDGGRRFGSPVLVDEARPRGRVDVELLSDGSALVSWIGIEDRMNALKVARVTEHSGAGESLIIAVPQSPAFTGIPQLALGDSEVFVAWVDGGHPDSTRILLDRRPLADFD